MTWKEKKMRDRASNYTVVPVSTTTTIESGDSVTVFGIHAEGANAESVLTVNDADGNLIFVISLLDNTSYINDVCWLADAGVQLVTDANTRATIWHSKGGS
jgi:hypothetical protein